MSATIILDIGKTNAKLVLLDDAGAVLAEQRSPNTIVREGLYPHHDTERIWEWMLEGMRAFARQAQVSAIVPVTHGATAALVDDEGLVLPVLDYEYALPVSQQAHYAVERPPYSATHSPMLPAGLNLGRQLVWQSQAFPKQFRRARHILMYPQYWAWRLCGVAASEVTSLGCHTDLWQPARKQYSSLVERMGWNRLFPSLRPAWTPLHTIKPELALRTGLPAGCRIICGIHDSNASLLRHLTATPQPAVLSTGTWVIAAAPGMPLDGLREQSDMLANSNAFGEAVPCMRFMGGREFAELAGSDAEPCGIADLQTLIGQATMALPSFAGASGPFAARTGSIDGPLPANSKQRYALATLYCVLMSDYCLDALGVNADGADIAIEGSFTGNQWFGPLLAALRPQQTVYNTDDSSGTACGGWMLHHWGRSPSTSKHVAQALMLAGWEEYKQRWLNVLL
ncbi:FGGY-family carbohydrate kinase [Duganella radicis]|uniref:L-fuculose kinase n=1 Tax=Duganella radicis TaxID=551988 RepID=A0A6L6PCW5_9BURK|nr:FGGY family carbohydrate kinase [Duganella radicis]MTV36215.1 L-fuculose kinase [Duganella radicis]